MLFPADPQVSSIAPGEQLLTVGSRRVGTAVYGPQMTASMSSWHCLLSDLCIEIIGNVKPLAGEEGTPAGASIWSVYLADAASGPCP